MNQEQMLISFRICILTEISLKTYYLDRKPGASLGAQGQRILLPRQETRV